MRKWLTFLLAVGLCATGVSVVGVGADDRPVCASAASDPDGDGWGWENERSCRVVADGGGSDGFGGSDESGGSEEVAAGGSTPFCYSRSTVGSNGWGWEDERSCRAVPPVTFAKVKDSHLFHTLYFEVDDSVEVLGWKLYRDGVEWTTVYRRDGVTSYVRQNMVPGDTTVYGFETIVAGGGLDYTARVDIMVPTDISYREQPHLDLVRTARSFKAGDGPLTAAQQADRVVEVEKANTLDAYGAEIDARRELEQAGRNVDVVHNSNTRDPEVTIESEARGGELSVEISFDPSFSYDGATDSSSMSATSGGRTVDLTVEAKPGGNANDVQRYVDAAEAYEKAKDASAAAERQLEAAIDQAIACQDGGGDDCRYVDPPAPPTTTPSTTPGGCEDSGTCPDTTVPTGPHCPSGNDPFDFGSGGTTSNC
ncbi:MAG: carbohydrate-binding domain-containing protein [Actinomycetota bacterium]